MLMSFVPLCSRLAFRSWLRCAAVLLPVLWQAEAVAQSGAGTPVYLWGIQAGCEQQEQSTKNLADALARQGVPVQFLRSPKEQPLPVCPGPVYSGSTGCMDALKAQCSGATGSVVGGLIEKGKQITRTRLWLYDLATGRQAVRDDYCHQCDPDLDKVLAAHVRLLLQAPPWEPALSSQPMYCRESTVERTRPSGRLFLGVFGAFPGGDMRAELMRRIALKRSAANLDAPQPISERLAPERITAGSPGSQVLMIEKAEGAKASLTLWDQNTQRLASRSVPCAAGCLEVVTQAAAELQDTCFEAGCVGIQPADVRPIAACEPWPDSACPAFVGNTGETSGSSALLSSGQATATMALIGTGLGLSVATSIGLWIANEKVFLLVDKYSINRLFTPAAAATTALTVGLIGLSVPAFLWLDAHRKSTAAGAGSSRSGGKATELTSPLVCPGAAPSSIGTVPASARTVRARGQG